MKKQIKLLVFMIFSMMFLTSRSQDRVGILDFENNSEIPGLGTMVSQMIFSDLRNSINPEKIFVINWGSERDPQKIIPESEIDIFKNKLGIFHGDYPTKSAKVLLQQFIKEKMKKQVKLSQ